MRLQPARRKSPATATATPLPDAARVSGPLRERVGRRCRYDAGKGGNCGTLRARCLRYTLLHHRHLVCHVCCLIAGAPCAARAHLGRAPSPSRPLVGCPGRKQGVSNGGSSPVLHHQPGPSAAAVAAAMPALAGSGGASPPSTSGGALTLQQLCLGLLGRHVTDVVEQLGPSASFLPTEVKACLLAAARCGGAARSTGTHTGCGGELSARFHVHNVYPAESVHPTAPAVQPGPCCHC